MKEEYINAFLAPAKMVWEAELCMPLQLAGTWVASESDVPEDVTAANTINNAAGTTTTGDDLIVTYWDNPAVGEIATLTFASKGVVNLMDPFPLETDIPFEL